LPLSPLMLVPLLTLKRDISTYLHIRATYYYSSAEEWMISCDCWVFSFRHYCCHPSYFIIAMLFHDTALPAAILLNPMDTLLPLLSFDGWYAFHTFSLMLFIAAMLIAFYWVCCRLHDIRYCFSYTYMLTYILLPYATLAATPACHAAIRRHVWYYACHERSKRITGREAAIAVFRHWLRLLSPLRFRWFADTTPLPHPPLRHYAIFGCRHSPDYRRFHAATLIISLLFTPYFRRFH